MGNSHLWMWMCCVCGKKPQLSVFLQQSKSKCISSQDLSFWYSQSSLYVCTLSHMNRCGLWTRSQKASEDFLHPHGRLLSKVLNLNLLLSTHSVLSARPRLDSHGLHAWKWLPLWHVMWIFKRSFKMNKIVLILHSASATPHILSALS